ncbi:hypothetical protein C8Q75DRAFT_818176 [Abortiporus biennis]|nr:hypothetical protein C8Q75DRAFT_818176 [Abortiporus biennis]
MHVTYHHVCDMFALCNEPLHKAIPPVLILPSSNTSYACLNPLNGWSIDISNSTKTSTDIPHYKARGRGRLEFTNQRTMSAKLWIQPQCDSVGNFFTLYLRKEGINEKLKLFSIWRITLRKMSKLRLPPPFESDPSSASTNYSEIFQQYPHLAASYLQQAWDQWHPGLHLILALIAYLTSNLPQTIINIAMQDKLYNLKLTLFTDKENVMDIDISVGIIQILMICVTQESSEQLTISGNILQLAQVLIDVPHFQHKMPGLETDPILWSANYLPAPHTYFFHLLIYLFAYEWMNVIDPDNIWINRIFSALTELFFLYVIPDPGVWRMDVCIDLVQLSISTNTALNLVNPQILHTKLASYLFSQKFKINSDLLLSMVVLNSAKVSPQPPRRPPRKMLYMEIENLKSGLGPHIKEDTPKVPCDILKWQIGRDYDHDVVLKAFTSGSNANISAAVWWQNIGDHFGIRGDGDEANKMKLGETGCAWKECLCSSCKPFHSMQTCTGCKKVTYCNGICQKKDWKEHRKICPKHL